MKRTLLLCFAAAVTVAAADLPHAGKWKMNPAKSDFGETTLTFTSLPADEWEAAYEGIRYKFRMDGKDYPNGMGVTAAWKAVNETSWETVWKLNDKVLYTQTFKVDGKALTSSMKGTMPNGEAMDEVSTFQRVSGSTGLAGKWRMKNLKTGAPPIIEFTASGTDGLVFSAPAMQLTCDAKFDGRDYPCSGPTLPPGWTIAMTKLGDRALSLAIKKDGKAFYNETYTVSGNGKVLTVRSGAVATHEMARVVYDRI